MIDKWWERAACLDIPVPGNTPLETSYNRTQIFYGKTSPNKTLAFPHCEECSVSKQCLADAMSNEVPYIDEDGHLRKPYRYGIWGGKTPLQRQKLYESKMNHPAGSSFVS